MRRYPPISAAEILSVLSVDLNTGCVRWIRPPRCHAELLGLVAGSVRGGKKPYWIIKIGRIPYKRSYLIFSVKHGVWPTMIDHIDGNSLNDAASNLRLATPEQNSWNHRGRKKKCPLPMGIRLTKNGGFQARIAFRKRSFSLGVYRSVEEAHCVYLSKRRELFGEFSGL